MDREPAATDVIEAEMEQTRVSLTDKVAALEQQVVGTLQSATETVQSTVQTVQETVESVKLAVEDTVSNVKDTVTESVSAVKETVAGSVNTVTDQVKSAFDVSGHVRDNPWAMVGGAAAVGFALGLLIPGGGRRSLFGSESLGFRETPGTPTPPSPSYAAAHSQPTGPKEASAPSWIDGLLCMAGQEIRKLGEEALTTAVASLRQSMQEQVPHLIETGIASATEGISQHLHIDPTAGRRANGASV